LDYFVKVGCLFAFCANARVVGKGSRVMGEPVGLILLGGSLSPSGDEKADPKRVGATYQERPLVETID